MQSLLEVERSSAGGAAGDVISSQKLSAALSELSSVSQLLRDSESKCNEARRMARETDVEKQEVEHRLAQKAMAWESESRSLTSKVADLEASVLTLRAEKSTLGSAQGQNVKELDVLNRDLRQVKNSLLDEEMARKAAEREKEYFETQVARLKSSAEEGAKVELRLKLENERLVAEKDTLRTKLKESEEAVRELSERVAVLERKEARSMVMDSASVVDRAQGHVSDRDKLLMEKIEKLETEHLSLKRQISEPKDTQPEDDKYEEEKSYWRGKVDDEKKLLDDAKALLKGQKDKLKKRQKQLERSKATWRKERGAMNPNDNRKRWDLRENKRRIDREAEHLNAMVKKLRKTQLWLNGREGKVASLEGVIRKMVQIRERDGSGDEDRSILHHVQELQRITETLEGEVGTEDFDDFDYENDGFIGSVSGLGRTDDGTYWVGGGGEQMMGYSNFVPPQQQMQMQMQYMQQPPMHAPPMNAWGAGAGEAGVAQVISGKGGPAIASFQSQLKEWTRDRIETQQEVGYHVSWLDDLRKEMTTNMYGGGMGGLGVGRGGGGGGGGDENVNQLNLSATAKALLSPRTTTHSGGSGGSKRSSRTRKELFAREI